MKKIFKIALMLILVVNLAVVFTVKANPTVRFDCDTIESYTDIISEDVYGVATDGNRLASRFRRG